jgi:hypothetical protein
MAAKEGDLILAPPVLRIEFIILKVLDYRVAGS